MKTTNGFDDIFGNKEGINQEIERIEKYIEVEEKKKLHI